MKLQQKAKARRLRKNGLAVTTIASALAVAKSSVYEWTKDIALSAYQKHSLGCTHRQAACNAAQWRASSARDARMQFQSTGRSDCNTANWKHVAGCMLYWAEGSKNRNSVVFTNTDVNMMRLFLEFLRGCFGVPNHKVALRIHCHATSGQKPQELEEYWMTQLSLEGCIFHKPNIKKKRTSPTRYWNGVCTLTVNDTGIVNRIWGSIQHYAGFDAPDMLK